VLVSPPEEISHITVSDAVLHQQVGEETVLLNMVTEQYHGLDEVGSRVWQLLREHRTVDPIVAALLQEYEVDDTALRADVERLLGELSDLGLIQIERD
jgi:hypothetical protein